MSKLEQICEVYGISIKRGKDIVNKFPKFAKLNHERAVREAVEVYGDEGRVKKAMLRHLPFSGYDHERVVREATGVYGDEARVKEAVLSFPAFAGYDHERVLRQKTRIGRLIGLTNQETIDYILERPVNAGYSYRRDLARIDVARTLRTEGIEFTDEVRDWFMDNYMKSPYSPGTRLRISRSSGMPEPNLLIDARKRFADQLKAA